MDQQRNRKESRRARALMYLENYLKRNKEILNQGANDLQRIETEISQLLYYLGGGKKKKRVKAVAGIAQEQGLRYYIDIYGVQFAPTSRSTRRKNKGKSRKRLKKKRITVFIKSVVSQPGMLQRYLDGSMGISPKFHAFKMRREDMIRQ